MSVKRKNSRLDKRKIAVRLTAAEWSEVLAVLGNVEAGGYEHDVIQSRPSEEQQVALERIQTAQLAIWNALELSGGPRFMDS